MVDSIGNSLGGGGLDPRLADLTLSGGVGAPPEFKGGSGGVEVKPPELKTAKIQNRFVVYVHKVKSSFNASVSRLIQLFLHRSDASRQNDSFARAEATPVSRDIRQVSTPTQAEKAVAALQSNAIREGLSLSDETKAAVNAAALPKSAYTNGPAPSLEQRRYIETADSEYFNAAGIEHKPWRNIENKQIRDGIGALPGADLGLTETHIQEVVDEAVKLEPTLPVERRAELREKIGALKEAASAFDQIKQSKLFETAANDGAQSTESIEGALIQLGELSGLQTDIDRLSIDILSIVKGQNEDDNYGQLRDLRHAVNTVGAHAQATQINTVNLIRSVGNGYQNNSFSVDSALRLSAAGIEVDNSIQSDSLRTTDWTFARKDDGKKEKIGGGITGSVLKLVPKEGAAVKSAVFKPLQVRQADAQVYENYGVVQANQRSEARNLATKGIDDALGFNLVPAVAVIEVEGELGLAMEQAKGETSCYGKFSGRDEPDKIKVEGVLSDSAALRDLSNLEVLDALTGQLDRSPNNYIVDFNPETLAYKGLKAIDNDISFLPGSRFDLSEAEGRHKKTYEDGRRDRIGLYIKTEYRGVGLPNFIDQETAYKLRSDEVKAAALQGLSGLIEAEALVEFSQRWDVLVDHTYKLEKNGCLVNDWNTRRDEIAKTQKEKFNHSYYGRDTLMRFPSEVTDGRPSTIYITKPRVRR